MSFNLFSTVNCRVEQSISSTIPKKMLSDLDCCNIKLSKSSNVERNQSLGLEESDSLESIQKCKYLVGYFFHGQAQMFIFKEY